MPRPTLFAALALALGLGLTACSGDGTGTDAASQDTAAQEQAPADDTGADDTAADGGDAQDGDVVETVAVTAQEMSYTGFPETLPAGTIRIDFENAGQAGHDLVVEELGDQQVVPVIDGGTSQSATVTLEPGTYTFYCSVGSHRAMGMEVTVTVE
ncbi:cupredoxin domain-containing protein [Nocardiopsis sp. NPDC050513]|uniref:cupredoxin domain-containing protein n=1 Tax=Nocardiopsis sp. NPDC050513 TaxID=3364338 RepID=UPI00379A0F5C